MYILLVPPLVYIMKTLSLKIDENIFAETEKILSEVQLPRNRYINEALDFYNRIQKRKLLEERFKYESNLVREESMKVLKEFEAIDYAD
jgi:hypothetical protein